MSKFKSNHEKVKSLKMSEKSFIWEKKLYLLLYIILYYIYIEA